MSKETYRRVVVGEVRYSLYKWGVYKVRVVGNGPPGLLFGRQIGFRGRGGVPDPHEPTSAPARGFNSCFKPGLVGLPGPAAFGSGIIKDFFSNFVVAFLKYLKFEL